MELRSRGGERLWPVVNGDCGRVRWMAEVPFCELVIDFGGWETRVFVGYN